jgi:hypothetical protein
MPYLLALLAAVLFAVSTVQQQGAARSSALRAQNSVLRISC